MDSSKILTREQFDNWRRQSETEAFFDFVRRQMQECVMTWTNGNFNFPEDAQRTLVANTAAVENINLCKNLMELDYEGYSTAMKDE